MSNKNYNKEWRQKGKGKLPYLMRESQSANVFATDILKQPVSRKYITKIKATEKEIEVGSVQKREHGTLKCFIRDDLIIVGLYEGDEEKIIQELLYKPRNKKELINGAEIPESKFTMENHFFIGTPWHEMDGISIWTVAGLRRNGKSVKSWYNN